MKQVWKDILPQGSVSVCDPDTGEIRQVTFALPDIEQAYANGKAKIAQGYTVPACWDHQAVGPTKSINDLLADRARHTFGYASDFRMNAGTLEALINLPADADADQFAKVRYVSPEIEFNWVDSEGKTWPGMSIVHVAATPRPVIRDQKPVQLSQLPTNIRRMRLSHPIDATTMIDATTLVDPSITPTPKGGVSMSTVEKLSALLSTMGIVLPDGTTDETLPAALVAAMVAKADAAAVEPKNDDDDGMGNSSDDTISTAQISPLTLSLNTQQKQFEGYARANLTEQIKALRSSNRITQAIAAELTEKAKTVKLSHGAGGTIEPNEVTLAIECYAKLPAGTTVTGNGRTKVDLSNGAQVVTPAGEVDAMINGEKTKTAAEYAQLVAETVGR